MPTEAIMDYSAKLVPRFENSSKLVTREDAYHLHKVFGFLSLAHFLYRLYRWVRFGATNIMDINERYLPFWIFIHSCLSLSSLLFHLPSNRPTSVPVIWPEYRLHSIIFAGRSLVIMSLTLTGKDLYYTRVGVVVATMIAADVTTVLAYHSQHKTMRGMPYPKEWSPVVCSRLHLYYSISQVFATARMMWHNHELACTITEPFLILFPIQLAAFLMTLVKKGIITSEAWHVYYSISLGLNYLYHAAIPYETQTCYPVLLCVIAFCYLRFRHHLSKYVLWITFSLVARTWWAIREC